MAKEADSGRTMGDVLDEVEVVRGRSIENWRSKIGEVQQGLNSIAEKSPEMKELAKHHAATCQALWNEMDRAARGWVSTREELDGRTAYADLQNKLIEGWPRSAVADRLFYVGTGLLGGGGIAYAVLGSSGLAEYAVLWTSGVAMLIGSIVFLRSYDKARAKHFAEVLNRVR